MGLSSKAVIGPVSLTSTATELHAVTVDGAVPVTVTYSATPTFNFNLGNLFKITLTGDATPTFINVGTASRRTMFLIAQDATGGRAFTWPAGWTNMPPVTRTASAVTAIEALFDGTNAYPVAPGSNLKLQVDDKTINAGFFAGASNALRVNAAIAYAVANSFTAVRVPASLLPYDASAVTFNTGVRMIAEGTNPAHYDIRAYGATLDGVANDRPALLACAAPNGKINVPQGKVGLDRPWIPSTIVDVEGIEYSRVSPGGAVAISSIGLLPGVAGPAVVLQDGTTSFGPLATGLVSGVGQSFGNGTQLTTWLDFRDSRTCDLNGLSAFTAETFFKVTDTSTQRVILASQGLNPDSGLQRCFHILQDTTLQARIKISGSTKTISGGTISSGVVYWVALVFDGATAYLFYGQPGGTSTLIGSTAAAGTLTQDDVEQVTLGPSQGLTPDTGIFDFNSIAGYWYSTRLSKSARYTTTGPVPNAAFANDSNTLMLLNFDLQDSVLTRGETFEGDAWLFLRNKALSTGKHSRLTNLGFFGNGGQSSGLLAAEAALSEFTNLAFDATRDSLAIYGNSFGCTVTRPWFNGVKRYGFRAMQNSGIVSITAPYFSFGGKFPFTLLSSSANILGGYIGIDSTTRYHVVLASAGNVGFYGTVLSCEGGNSTLRASLVLYTANNLVYSGGTIDTTNGAAPIMVTANSSARFDGVAFVNANASPAILNATSGASALGRPVDFTGSRQMSAWVPWSDTPGTAIIGAIGKGASIAFSTPLTLDCSLRDDFEVGALTGAITINFSNVTPGQKISLWTVQNAGGGNSITFGTVNGTGAVKGATANDTTGLHETQYLFDALLNGNLRQVGFSSGA